jgi:hypothetical protein
LLSRLERNLVIENGFAVHYCYVFGTSRSGSNEHRTKQDTNSNGRTHGRPRPTAEKSSRFNSQIAPGQAGI